MVGNIRGEGGSESGSAWADVARGQPDSSDNTPVALTHQQYRHPTDFDQSSASTTRTIAGTRTDGASAQPGPRTWDDLGRQQRRGGSNAVANKHGQGGGISEGNWVARTRGADAENNGFEQRRGNRRQGGVGVEDSRVAKPLDGQTPSRMALDGGAGNGADTFHAGKGSKMEKTFNLSGADKNLVIESASPQVRKQRVMERGHPMFVEARSYYSQPGQCFA